MDLKQLRSFVAIVEYQNFSKAAEKLNIAQSSVSTHLQMLEKELGSKLLHRTTKIIEVTDEGRAVYKYASQILELEDCMHQACSGQARRILRIGASTIPSAYILPEVLQQYSGLFPNDYARVSQCESKAVIEGLLDNRFDVGLVGYALQREGLCYVPICRNRMVLITPVTERYLQMHRSGASLTELLKEPIILRETGSRRGADQLLDRLGMDQDNLNVVARVNDQETVKKMVAGGMGVSLISEVAAGDFLKSRRLLKFDLPKYLDTQNIYLVYPENYTPKDHAWKFIDYLRESRELSFHMM